MRHKDVIARQRKMTKDIMLVVEDLVKKYKIPPDEYNHLRMIIKSGIWGYSNVWYRFFVTVVDAKFEKKINEEGEKLETHLRTNGKDINE